MMDKADFTKFPKTPHIFLGRSGSGGAKEGWNDNESLELLNGETVTLTEKLDGTNVAFSFPDGNLMLQSRGALVNPDFDKQFYHFQHWVLAKSGLLELFLGEQYVMFGELTEYIHTIEYDKLPHFFFPFDIYSIQQQRFLGQEAMDEMILNINAKAKRTELIAVPLVYVGPISSFEQLEEIATKTSRYGNSRMEGVYGRIDGSDGFLETRFKFVNPEFTKNVDFAGAHWRSRGELIRQKFFKGQQPYHFMDPKYT